jgi:hypothetical protein
MRARLLHCLSTRGDRPWRTGDTLRVPCRRSGEVNRREVTGSEKLATAMAKGKAARRTILAMCLLAVLATAADASAARQPTPSERSALTQALFDAFPRVASKQALAATRVTSIAVSTKSPKFPAAARFYYSKFASVELFNPRVGAAYSLLGYYVSPGLSGWRLLSGPGTSEVGCDVSDTVFHGYKRVVLKDIRLGCP